MNAVEWDAAVLDRPDAIPFHAWDFLQACADAWSVSFEPLVARVGGTVVGGVPRMVDHRYGMRWVNHLNLVNFLGPAADAEHVGPLLEALGAHERLRTVRERQEVRLAPDRAPSPQGWQRRVATSMVVPLADRSVEDLTRQAGKNFKAAPRLARKFGTLIEPSTEEDLRSTLPALMHQVFDRAGHPTPYADDTYWRVYEAFAARGAAHAVTARIDGEVAGVSITLVGRSSVAFEWVSADDARFRPAETSLATQRALILWAHEAGYSGYELLGGTTEGIAAFKRSLGAREEEYVVYERGLRS